jgi:SSS family solute:Na+ symporter
MNLTYLDLGVMGVPLAIVLAVTVGMRRYMRSVADFLAASRCAGRYLICTASAETGAGVMIMISTLEVFSRTGFSLRFWDSITSVIFFFFGLVGLITYRFRETRALTFHQFFELRYSRGVRVFASFLNVFSGLFNFGLQPAVGARFFVYFCGCPSSACLAA